MYLCTKIFVYTRYSVLIVVVLIISFISFPCPQSIVYNMCSHSKNSPFFHCIFCHFGLNLKKCASCKHSKIRKYKGGVSKSELRNGTFRDPLGSERLPIIRFLNTTIDVAGWKLWGTQKSSWEQYDSSRQERQAVITQRSERLSWREIAKKS